MRWPLEKTRDLLAVNNAYLVQNDVLLPYRMPVPGYNSKMLGPAAVFRQRIRDNLPPPRWQMPVAKFELRILAERPPCTQSAVEATANHADCRHGTGRRRRLELQHRFLRRVVILIL
jgi:hypothetical protein